MRVDSEDDEISDKSAIVGQMKVLHVSQPTDAGVAAVILSYLSLPEDGTTHIVACPADSLLAREVSRLGHEHVAWEATRSPSHTAIIEALKLHAIINHHRPDVVHLHSSKAGLAGRLAVRGLMPTVFQPHAWSFSAVDGFTRALSLRWERFAQRWTHATLCVGEDERSRGLTAGVLREGSSARSGRVVRNSIDPTRWSVLDRSTARADLGLPIDDPLVVCVGRLCRQKGQDVLLSAWPEVTRALSHDQSWSGPPCLVLVGDGPDRSGLELATSPGVRFVGAGDPQAWYAAADVVVVPSRWEGMAMVPLEAQASARLVVATDVDGMRESLQPDHIIVEAEQSGPLAAALIQTLSDLPATHVSGEAARQWAERQWSPSAQLRELQEIYDQAVAAL